MAQTIQLRNDMSTPSNWPLSAGSVRYLVPRGIVEKLDVNPISHLLYPTAFGYYEHAREHKVIRNSHDDHLLMFCVDGNGHIETAQTTTELAAQQVVILPKGMAHSYWANAKSPWTIYWVHIQGALFENILDIVGFTPTNLVFNVHNKIQYEENFRALLEIRKLSYQTNAFYLAGAIIQRLLIELSVQYPNSSRNKKQLQFQQIDIYLQQNIAKTLTLDDMAVAFGLSKFYFAKKFQLIVGVSPVRYFIEKKVHYACQLLDSNDNSIKTIAKQLGYDDAYYFSRLFKNIMGLSPQQYRNSDHGR
ncbi:AraC family transcriptional regulator [Psychrosphaera sp. B3R10]|uniref:helix-turn-helix domain-containing protein n=1 Tax=unclassified Psychrosphaera TaxID=2641570 RepID=UPI001C09580B|nr:MULTISPECIES: AraC family transcriptional regulator [unclassified Psychrosphaera]MBU2882821.1 AraC family transcriptional regulator [Psychrosphaera sp. I2R16]MBU2988029.1 AraC family transcriptional regulator [Psychrosphaera sp. B3R10]MDO6721049.1 AraC family transcriptional regulator [Psychrosphaera sp. 1_MG-2023]